MNALTGTRAYGLLALRLLAGWVFLYAGIEKLIGAEKFSAAGFLQFGTAGTAAGAAEGAIVNPTNAFWVDLAANTTIMPIVDVVVPWGQVLIGAALILGLATRFAAVMGFAMMAFITVAAWDFAHGAINYTAFIAIVTLLVGVMRAGEVFGIDAIVDEQPLVKRTPALRYVLG